MAAPNLIGATTINGKTTGANLSTTSATLILNNAAASGKCLKVNTLNVTNSSASSVSITVNYYTAASLGGTALPIAGSISIPANSTLNIIDKTSQYYLEENTCIGASAGTSNVLTVTVSYEDIS